MTAVAILTVGLAGFLFWKNQTSSSLPKLPSSPSSPSSSTAEEFVIPKKSAHFESNTPAHGTSLAGVPINVVIDFNYDLATGSEIKIETAGKDYGLNKTVIDSNKLAMRKKMDPSSPDGIYTVTYKACWADGSCQDGQFQFKIDRSQESNFTDMTGQKEVKINLAQIAFSPAKVRISKGTKVIWQNMDSVIHTVNSDSHPAHTYFPEQNSRDLKKGDTYSVTFLDSGIYLYHCTPHAATMQGQILVE